MEARTYIGLLEDTDGGMTNLGRTVLDARVFGLIPESETCAGWQQAQMQMLMDQVYAAWEPYGHIPSRLPEELLARHQRIYTAAIEHARAAGWDPSLDDED